MYGVGIAYVLPDERVHRRHSGRGRAFTTKAKEEKKNNEILRKNKNNLSLITTNVMGAAASDVEAPDWGVI
jgi:hypothetical protein